MRVRPVLHRQIMLVCRTLRTAPGFVAVAASTPCQGRGRGNRSDRPLASGCCGVHRGQGLAQISHYSVGGVSLTRFPTQPNLANKPRAKIARKSSTRRDKVQVFTEADLTVHAALGELQAVSSQTFNTVHYS